MPQLGVLFVRFGLALVLGFLIGLERERDKPLIFAGMRTFALISLLGAVMAFVSDQFSSPWLLIVGFGAVAAFALVSYSRGFETGHIGITTEVAFLLAFILGAMLYWDLQTPGNALLTLAAAITIGVILVLNFKPDLQAFVKHIDRQDIWAGLEFAIVWIIVLPILPTSPLSIDPLHVLNLHQIWVMVVFVAAINLAGYVLSQVYGRERGIGLAGVLGGMISSTAVTYEFARRSSSEEERNYGDLFALAIAIASTGMFFRATILAFVINFTLGMAMLLPMTVGAVISGLGVLYLWLLSRSQERDIEGAGNAGRRSPFALRPALQFGLIFAAVLWLSQAARLGLGNEGAYITSVIGGVAGLDAVTLSIANLSLGSLPIAIAVRAITLGAAANTLFKMAIALTLGNPTVRTRLLPLFLLVAVASTGTAFLFVH